MQSTPLTIAQVEDRLAAFMRLRGQTMRRYFYNIGLFNGHPAMLFHIARQPGVTQTEIAQRMEISKASVAVSVKVFLLRCLLGLTMMPRSLRLD